MFCVLTSYRYYKMCLYRADNIGWPILSDIPIWVFFVILLSHIYCFVVVLYITLVVRTWHPVVDCYRVDVPRFCLQEFPSSGRWPQCGPQWISSRLRHRHCGRCRRERHGSTAQAFRGHDPHPDFCWGLGSLRTHRCAHSLYKIGVVLKSCSFTFIRV